jgi:LuxR family maltose regulon positive regulatory protein
MALDLPETAVTALEKRTEGWIAGLQMAALSLQGRTDIDRFISDFSGSHRYIFDYLTEEVLAGQTAEIRGFLLQTAVLDRLCAPLCDALLEASKSQHILEQLEAANLFLMPLDDARHWYRYHQLFADLLRQQMRRERPEYESLLHHRASYWFEQAGFTDEAIQHALAAADYERAASLVAEYSQSLVNHGEMNKLLSWINRLPAEWQRRHPHLIFNHAYALLFHSSAQEMEATLAHMPDAVANSLPYSAYLLVLRCIAATRQGQTDEAIALAEKAEEQLAALEPNQINQSMRGVGALVLANEYRARDGERAGHLYDTAVSLSRESGNLIAFLTAVRDRGRFLLEQGQLHQAETVFRKGIQSEQQWAGKLGSPNRKLLAAAPIHASLAQLLYEWNRLDEAEVHLADALRLLPLVGPVNHSQGLTTLARLRLAQGNSEAVLPIVKQLETMQEEASNRYTRRWLAIAITETTCALYRQEPTTALQFALEQSLAALANEPLGDEPLAVLAQARVLLALARPADALPLLETLAEQMQENGRHGLWLSAILMQCLAQQQMSEQEKALPSLQQALVIAEPSGYLRLFLDWGEPMAELLQTAVQHNVLPDYANKLLDHLRFTILDLRFESTFNHQSSIENRQSLSPRETEVLQLIAQGLTNKEIANELVIAPSTAKRHTVNIYNKLAISNRAEATAKAYELGIVNLA